jgi:hypothetical protein
MTSARHRKPAGSIAAAGKGDAIAELMLEVAQYFFRIRAIGQKTGLITSWGGVRLPAQPRAAGPADCPPDRRDAADQPPAHAAAGR